MPERDPEYAARLTAIEAAVSTLQRQIDAMGAAGDARAESGQHALDDLREIVCDPVNPRNHESRLSIVETRQTTTERRGGALGGLVPSPETVGAYGVGLGKWGWKAAAFAAFAVLVYMFATGTLVERIGQIAAILSPPVRVEVDMRDPRAERNSARIDSLANDTTR